MSHELAVPAEFPIRHAPCYGTFEVGDCAQGIPPSSCEPDPGAGDLIWYQGERELFGYNPSFVPGAVTFNPDDVPFIRIGTVVQRLDPVNGTWDHLDFGDVLRSYGWDGSDRANALRSEATDTRVVFDAAGDAYTHVAARLWKIRRDPADPSKGIKPSVLLHSRDNCETWTLYELPDHTDPHDPANGYDLGIFENWDSHNERSRPPAMLLWQVRNERVTLGFLVPEKVGSSLSIPPAPPTIAPAYPPRFQVGGSNMMITRGNYSYVGWAESDGRTDPAKYPLSDCADPTKPCGTTSHIWRYDHTLGAWDQHGVIGASRSRGSAVSDNHNLPALAFDNAGFIHAVLGAHNWRFAYQRSVRPFDISEWSAPELIGESDEPDCYRSCESYTYPSLVAGPDDTLHLVGRWAGVSRDTILPPGSQERRLVYFRKPDHARWERPRTLVVPFRSGYAHWYQKLSINRAGSLFLYYVYNPAVLFADEARMLACKWKEFDPVQQDRDREDDQKPCRCGYIGTKPAGGPPVVYAPTDRSKPGDPPRWQCHCPYVTGLHDPVVISSSDAGRSWIIATTADMTP